MIIKTKGNQLFLYGTIWSGDGAYFLDSFSKMDGAFPVIDVHMHCNGGSVFDGNLIFNTILTAKSACDGYIDGIAASMAGVLLIAFRKVYMAENGFIMLHAPSGYTSGDAKQHEANAGLLRSIEKNFLKKLIARTGKKEAVVKGWLVGDNWFDATQALEAGLIDEIIEPVTQVTIEDPAANLDNTFNSFAALMVGDGNPNNDFKTLLTMKKEAISKFGLTGVTEQSSDTAVLEAIQAHFDKEKATAQAALEAEKTKVTNLETAINTQRDAQITALLDAAEASKKITKAQRETYENIGKTSGVQALETVLGGITARTPIGTQIGKQAATGSVTARDGWDWDKYQKEKPRELEAMAQSDPEAYTALYEAKFNTPLKNQ